MEFKEYTITSKKSAPDATFILQVKPKKNHSIFPFLPGQYCLLQNPFVDAEDPRPFSIASAPETKEYLEFCIKIYGHWTQSFSRITPGNTLSLAGPFGEFTWDDHIHNAVFLAGGLGISPLLSMLRHLTYSKQNPHITLLYGNRTPDTVVYKDELEHIFQQRSGKLIHIFSHLPQEHSWQGYRGFITKAILEKEVDFPTKPVFFIVGPSVFIQKMKDLLAVFSIDEHHIRAENLAHTSQSRTAQEPFRI